MEYHLGWRQLPGTGPVKPGKHIRSLFLLLTTQMFGGSVTRALPLASAVELLHGATLVYDDIQDGGTMRRGRPAVWRIAGVAQGINVGAAVQASVHAAVLRAAAAGLKPDVTLEAGAELATAMLCLAEGQYLDLRLRAEGAVGIEQYMDVCAKKAASLCGSAGVLGVLAAGRQDMAALARQLGHHLGMYLQISDDIDGIWGEAETMGKLPDDLLQKRRTLPVLYAFQRSSLEEDVRGATAALWRRFLGEGPWGEADVVACLNILRRYDSRSYAVTLARLHADNATQTLARLQAEAIVPGTLSPLFEAFSLATSAGHLGAILQMPDAQPVSLPASGVV